jgi:hypothetical protein
MRCGSVIEADSMISTHYTFNGLYVQILGSKKFVLTCLLLVNSRSIMNSLNYPIWPSFL